MNSTPMRRTSTVIVASSRSILFDGGANRVGNLTLRCVRIADFARLVSILPS